MLGQLFETLDSLIVRKQRQNAFFAQLSDLHLPAVGLLVVVEKAGARVHSAEELVHTLGQLVSV